MTASYRYVTVDNKALCDIHFGLYITYEFKSEGGVTKGSLHYPNTGYYPIDQSRSSDPSDDIPAGASNQEMTLYVHAAGGVGDGYASYGPIPQSFKGQQANFTVTGTVDDISIHFNG